VAGEPWHGREPVDQAKADYAKLNQMLIDDVAYIPLLYSNGAFLIKSYVKGAGTNTATSTTTGTESRSGRINPNL